MAILKGFPPSNTLSAQVRVAEKDLSFIAPTPSFHRAGLVGFASKGPINIPTLIQTTRQLNVTFGFPHPEVGDPYLVYAGQQYLLVANELFVVRVAETDPVNDEAATVASVSIPSAGGLCEAVASVDDGSLYVFTTSMFFKWRLNGVLASKTLVVLAGSYTATDLADFLNDQLDAENDGIEWFVFTALGLDYIAVRTVFAFGPDASLEFVSVKDMFVGGGSSIVGLGTTMTQAINTGSLDRYGALGTSAGLYDLTGLVAPFNIQIVVDGTDNTTIDNVVQVIDLADLLIMSQPVTISDVVTEVNDQITPVGSLPGGWISEDDGAGKLRFETLTFGRDSRLLIKSVSTASNVFGLSNLTVTGTSPTGSTPDPLVSGAASAYGIINGTVNTSGEVTFTVNAETAGIEGNFTQVVITNDERESSFIMDVFNNGVQVETWGRLTKDTASRFYVSTFLSLVSEFVRVDDDTAVLAPPADGTYDLSDGSDGIPSDPENQDTLLVGNPIGGSGLYALSEPEQIDIDVLAVPGHASTSVINAMIDVCQNYRTDCLAIIDPPFGLTVNEMIHWHNGTHPLNSTRFDTDFAALYWPWVKISDSFNGVDVWVPPSGSVLAVYALSDSIAAPWFAPAGETRGVVPGILDVFSRPTLAERDLMYGTSNAINTIIQFSDTDGFVVWGQKTLQRTPTALNRINVRRLMFVLEKRIRVAVRRLLFDPHDDEFTNRFLDIVKAIMDEVLIGRGLVAYRIQADAELNTPDVIDRNEFRARIGVQPTRAVEFMFIEFSIHRTGDFSSSSDTF